MRGTLSVLLLAVVTCIAICSAQQDQTREREVRIGIALLYNRTGAAVSGSQVRNQLANAVNQ